VLSPVSRAAAAKSRLRMASVCARITRAPHGQPSTLSTTMVATWPFCGR
jgi:hypothetical protein